MLVGQQFPFHGKGQIFQMVIGQAVLRDPAPFFPVKCVSLQDGFYHDAEPLALMRLAGVVIPCLFFWLVH